MPDHLLTPTQAADVLGVHVDTLKRWAREGKVVGVRLPGGHWKFTRADLDTFIAAGRTRPETVA